MGTHIQFVELQMHPPYINTLTMGNKHHKLTITNIVRLFCVGSLACTFPSQCLLIQIINKVTVHIKRFRVLNSMILYAEI